MLPAAKVGATSATRKNWPRKNRSNSRCATARTDLRDAPRAGRPGEIDDHAEERHVRELQPNARGDRRLTSSSRIRTGLSRKIMDDVSLDR